MLLKANIQIALHIHSVRIMFFENYGTSLRFKISIYRTDNMNQKIYADPYLILQKKQQGSILNKLPNTYITKPLIVKADKQEILIQEICIFRILVDFEKINKYQLILHVQALQLGDIIETSTIQNKSLGVFQTKIQRASKVYEYVNINLDNYDGFVMKAFYSSHTAELKIVKTIQEKQLYSDFWRYFESKTEKFKKQKVKALYQYYLKFVQQQFTSLQQTFKKITDQCQYIYLLQQLQINKDQKICLQIQQLDNKIKDNLDPRYMIVELMIVQFTKFKQQLNSLWNKYLKFTLEHSKLLIEFTEQQYHKKCIKLLKINVFSSTITDTSLFVVSHIQNGRKQKISLYKKNWIKEVQNNLKYEFFIQNWAMKNIRKSPIFIEQIHNLKPISQNITSSINHIFILVHGFQGHKWDFILLKKYLLAQYSNIQIYISSINQEQTHLSIQLLGKQLAGEILEYLKNRVGNKFYRLSFIGHSLGGIIIRAALQLMKQYWDKFYTYMSMSSPHLGYLYNESTAMQIGLWYFKNWQKCLSINELMLSDSNNYENCYLFKLSKAESFSKFRKIILIASFQDKIVPYQSARIEKTKEVFTDPTHPKLSTISKMTYNLLRGSQTLIRNDVIFEILEKNLETYVGKTAHLKFLSDKNFLKILVCCFPNYFL